MKVYLLFGKTGSGKSYIGELLERQHISHIDGDKHITNEMRECLKTNKQMTEEMIGRFVTHLAAVINQHKQDHPHAFVVTQALYLDCYRQELLQAVPDLEFILIDSNEPRRMQRIRERFERGESKVTPVYATKMDERFEQPTHPYKCIVNEGNSDHLQVLLEEIMPELFQQNNTLTI